MPEGKQGSPAAMNPTAVERKPDRELVMMRTFNVPTNIVFEAWSNPNCSSVAGKTLVTLHELYPTTTAALDEALNGSAEGLPEECAQLDELLAARS